MDRSEREITRAVESLELCSLTARRELQRFIQRIVPVRMISDRMLGSRTFSYVTAALPGLQAFLLLTRLCSMAGEAAREDRYVVVDATVHRRQPRIAGGRDGCAKSGRGPERSIVWPVNWKALSRIPIASAPQSWCRLRNWRSSEALEAAGRLRENLHIKRVIAILNGVPAPLFTRAETEHAMAADAEHAGLVRRRMELDEAAREVRKKLGAAGLEAIELPMLFTAAFGKAEVIAA